MSAPTAIKYRGQLYKLATTKHKRCQPQNGVPTHWNEKQKKCMPLPKGLRQQIKRALKASAKADAATTAAKGSRIAIPHLRAQRAHGYATARHEVVAYRADQLGFGGVRHRHERAHGRHMTLESKHHHRAHELPLTNKPSED